ncbi:MAG: hypothetical protein DRJ05_12210 [Bacteroidetes bacterium]|nr:MAG: hypothetical protein DRJ05_12210 [Bacteroidota bacterium]
MKKMLLIVLSMAIGQFVFAQYCSDLFISEYVEGSNNNKAIEIYNPTDAAINLGEYQLVRYSNGGYEPFSVNLPEVVVGSNDAYVIALDKRDPDGVGYETPIDSALMEVADTFLCPVYEENKMMYFNGNDAVVLEKDGGVAIVDIFSKVGPPMTGDDFGWTNITDTTITWDNNGVPEDYTIVDYIVGPLYWLSWTKDNTLIRKPDVKHGITTNPDVFNVAMEWDSLPNNTFENLGFHDCDCFMTNIADKPLNIDVDIYPNPVTNGEINIESGKVITTIELMNTLGQTIKREEFVTTSKKYTLKLGGMDKGVYFVKIAFKNKNSLVKKIIVE